MPLINEAFPDGGGREFTYWRLQIETGRRDKLTVRAMMRADFLMMLSRWNAQQPGAWQYWEAARP